MADCLHCHAVSIAKPSEQMSNFWMIRFFKAKSEPYFGFLHIPTNDSILRKEQGQYMETGLESNVQC